MDIPTYLKHKPILKVEEYSKIDGKYAGATDAKGLSVGFAQWNNEYQKDLSAKVWRYVKENKKWSRMSEEVPIHRVLDLTTLVCSAIIYAKKGILVGDETFNVTATHNAELIDFLKSTVNAEYEATLEPSLKRLIKVLKQIDIE